VRRSLPSKREHESRDGVVKPREAVDLFVVRAALEHAVAGTELDAVANRPRELKSIQYGAEHGLQLAIGERRIDRLATANAGLLKLGLVQPDVDRLASWWHTDADLGRTMETYSDMTKSREAGFLDKQDTRGSFRDLFERLRQERVIPNVREGATR